MSRCLVALLFVSWALVGGPRTLEARPKARAAQARPAKGPSSANATAPGKASKGQVFRFDALRIEGLAGPNAFVLHQLLAGKRRSLLRRQRSFVHRIFGTLDAAASR